MKILALTSYAEGDQVREVMRAGALIRHTIPPGQRAGPDLLAALRVLP